MNRRGLLFGAAAALFAPAAKAAAPANTSVAIEGAGRLATLIDYPLRTRTYSTAVYADEVLKSMWARYQLHPTHVILSEEAAEHLAAQE